MGLVEIVSRDLWEEHMPFKSTLFTFENQTVLPIYERCDALGAAGKTEQVITAASSTSASRRQLSPRASRASTA